MLNLWLTLTQTILRLMNRGSNRLKSIEIRGFKSIPYDKPLKLEIGDINILLGANGAGKSNITSFFKLLEFMMKGKLQRYIAESGTNRKFLYYGAKKTPTMSAKISIEESKQKLSYGFSLTSAIPDRLILTSEEIESGLDNNGKSNVEHLHSDYNESGLIAATEPEKQMLRTLLGSCKVYQFSDSSQMSPMRQSSAVDTSHYLQSGANNLASYLYYLRNNYPESFRRITGYVRDVVPQFHEFYLEPEGGNISLKWVDNSVNDYVLSVDQLSDGSIRFIALATLLMQPNEMMPFVIVIDEPELGLHPYAIDQLNEMIMDASKHAQIIVATQSTAVLDSFRADDVTIIEHDSIAGGTIANRLSEEEYHDWLEEYTLSELWNKNIIGGRPV